MSASLLDGASPVPISDPVRLKDTLDPSRLNEVIRLRDWLMNEGAKPEEAGELLAGLAERLNVMDVPVDRIFTAIEALHSEYAGIGRSWTREEGITERLLPHGERRETVYKVSPFFHVNQTGEWLLLDLERTQDDLFPIVADLKKGGYRHYLTVPIRFANGAENGISFATRSEVGFGPQALTILRFIMPTLGMVTELRAVSKRLNDVLRIYVGDEPHRAILSGAILRGQVTRIRSAILFADMRNYTGLSSQMSPEEAVELLNAYFDCLVPPIEDEGGEVLKYLGDGLLAIFRDRGDDTGGAPQAALTAALHALERVNLANEERRFSVPIGVGIALHHGEAAYGNVGSGQRLDFTVIGRDVNLASRIAGLNKELSEPLLMSGPFVHHLWGNPRRLGSFDLQGIGEPIDVYRP